MTTILLVLLSIACTIADEMIEDSCSAELDNDLSSIPIFNVRQELLDHSSDQFPSSQPEILFVTDGVYVAIGYDLANTIIIETQTGMIIIDALSEATAANKVFNDYKLLRSNQRKEEEFIIEGIILTHYHTDHSMGVGFWLNLNIENGFNSLPKVYANELLIDGYKRFFIYSFFSIATRSKRQFGTLMYHDMDESIVNEKNLFINSGIGPHLNKANNATFINPKNMILISDKIYELRINDIILTLIHSPGETSDQTAIWYNDKKVLFVGDNFYFAFPNLYSIRGTTPRDPKKWMNSLEEFMDYNAEYLVGSHTLPISGWNNIQNELVLYRDLIGFVHDQTVRHMMKQLYIDEIVEKIEMSLPEILKTGSKQQFYGTIEWSVRSIYDMYLGWFQGDAAELYPSNAYDRGEGLYDIFNALYEDKTGGNMIETVTLYLSGIIQEAEKNKDDLGYIEVALKEERWALELVTSLSRFYDNMKDKQCDSWNKLMRLRWKIMQNIAGRSISANGRNYLISQYLEERFDDLRGNDQKINVNNILLTFPIEWILELFRFRVIPEAVLLDQKEETKEWRTNIKFIDSGLMFTLHLRNGGVLSIREYSTFDEIIINQYDIMADLIYLMNEDDFKSLCIGPKYVIKPTERALFQIIAFWSKFEFTDLNIDILEALQSGFCQ